MGGDIWFLVKASTSQCGLAVKTTGSGVSVKSWLLYFLACALGQVIEPLFASVKTASSCSWVLPAVSLG